jgi:hypothetical protein
VKSLEMMLEEFQNLKLHIAIFLWLNPWTGLPHCVRFSKDVLFEVQGKVKRLQRNPGLPHCVR